MPPVAPTLSALGATSTAPVLGSMFTTACDTFGAALVGAAADWEPAGGWEVAAPAPRSALAALPPPPPSPPPQAAVSTIAPPTRPAATTLRIDLTSIPSL
ncbi:hypothetical protein GCM10018790_24500 [Kitasatospora xanthocidica]|nr:hypothetical protein GCM10018790_24500 [Kitasatospora xanthocidica]